MRATKLSLFFLPLVCSFTEATLLTHDAVDHADAVGISTDFENEDSSLVHVNKAILVNKYTDYEQFSQTTKNNENGAKTRRATSKHDAKSEKNGTAIYSFMNSLGALLTLITNIILCMLFIYIIDSCPENFAAAVGAFPVWFCSMTVPAERRESVTRSRLFKIVLAAEATVIFLKFCGVFARFLERRTRRTRAIYFSRRFWKKLILRMKSLFSKASLYQIRRSFREFVNRLRVMPSHVRDFEKTNGMERV